MSVRIIVGHVIDALRTLAPESISCVVTSPPYWGLRDYQIPPQVWGGDPSCEHEWGAAIRTPWANAVPGPSGIGKNTEAGHWKPKETGGFCRKCSAWNGSLGLEPDYRLYVDHMVAVFRDVWRVLRPDGSVWLNLGDCYATGAGAVGDRPGGGSQGDRWAGYRGGHAVEGSGKAGPRIASMGPMTQPNRMPQRGLKPKDLVGVPWRVAFALQDDGWWLREDIVWQKVNPMPESVLDRCTRSHEFIFHLTKAERYYHDAAAIMEPSSKDSHARAKRGRSDHHKYADGGPGDQTIAKKPPSAGREIRAPGVSIKSAEPGRGIKFNSSFEAAVTETVLARNKRSVWTVASEPFPDAHFATYPPALIEPCILAGCPVGGVVLDPFGGAATTGLVADRLGRNAILVELNPEYAEIGRRRLERDGGMFIDVTVEPEG